MNAISTTHRLKEKKEKEKAKETGIKLKMSTDFQYVDGFLDDLFYKSIDTW